MKLYAYAVPDNNVAVFDLHTARWLRLYAETGRYGTYAMVKLGRLTWWLGTPSSMHPWCTWTTRYPND